MKTGADFKQRTDAAVYLGTSFGWLGNPGENFQQSALPCPVASDDAHDFALLHFKGKIVESPDIVRLRIADRGLRISITVRIGNRRAQATKRRTGSVSNNVSQRSIAFQLANAVLLAQAFTFDCDFTHRADNRNDRIAKPYLKIPLASLPAARRMRNRIGAYALQKARFAAAAGASLASA